MFSLHIQHFMTIIIPSGGFWLDWFSRRVGLAKGLRTVKIQHSLVDWPHRRRVRGISMEMGMHGRSFDLASSLDIPLTSGHPSVIRSICTYISISTSTETVLACILQIVLVDLHVLGTYGCLEVGGSPRPDDRALSRTLDASRYIWFQSPSVRCHDYSLHVFNL